MAAERQVIQLTGNIKPADAPDSSAGKEAVQKIIRGNSELFTDTYCNVCNALLISEVQRLSHYQSMKHAKTVRRYEELHQDGEPVAKRRQKHSIDSRNGEVDRNKSCHVCHMAFTSVADAHLHYQGKIHAKALKSAAEPKNLTDRDDYCNLCGVCVGRPEVSKNHFMGKKHKKREIKAKLVEQLEQIGYNSAGGYPCKTCHVVLKSVGDFHAHILGVKHQNRVIRLVTSAQRWLQWLKYGQKS
ncbi:zinc finger protein 346-like isoform X2 [Scyliorhinus torazame]|uniref:zinc finger protein 346-like isoform X2 n=1 Tax=Scyliorhinus torazame TaxID=75743 RepID=UPI003B5A22F8